MVLLRGPFALGFWCEQALVGAVEEASIQLADSYFDPERTENVSGHKTSNVVAVKMSGCNL